MIWSVYLYLRPRAASASDLHFWKTSSSTVISHLYRKYIKLRKWDVPRMHFQCDFKMWAWFPAVASQKNRKSWASISGEAHVLPRAARTSSATVSFYWYWSLSCGVTLNPDWESTGYNVQSLRYGLQPLQLQIHSLYNYNHELSIDFKETKLI